MLNYCPNCGAKLEQQDLCTVCGADLKHLFKSEKASVEKIELEIERPAPEQSSTMEVSRICPMCGEEIGYSVEKGSRVQVTCKSCGNTFTFWH